MSAFHPVRTLRVPSSVHLGTDPPFTSSGLWMALDQPSTWKPRSRRHPSIASLIARSFLVRFIRDIPHAPPMTANGSRTTVALASATPPHPPAIAAAVPPPAAVPAPAPAPAASEFARPLAFNLPSARSCRHV